MYSIGEDLYANLVTMINGGLAKYVQQKQRPRKQKKV